MSTNQRMRASLAILISVALGLVLASCSSGGYGTDANPQTSKYLFEQFKNGEELDPYDTGVGDVGVTMESMVQLSGVGYDKTKLAKAITWLTSHNELLKSPGLKAEYVFTAHALGFADDPTVATQLSELKNSIDANAVIKDTNSFSYCWVILGLAAAGEKELANKVAIKLASFVEASGGYKYIFGAKDSAEAADVTGFVILALKATEGYGSSDDEAVKNFISERARIWLIKNVQEAGYWTGYGEIDISGTAYAIMALRSLSKNTDPYIKWLKTQVNSKDGGIIAPWSAPDSDIFSTSQSILAINNLSFIDVLNHKVN